MQRLKLMCVVKIIKFLESSFYFNLAFYTQAVLHAHMG